MPARGSGCLSGSKISEISRRFAAAGRRWWWRHAVPSDLTVSASECLGITPLGGFRLNRWVPKFPNLKHHVLGLLGGGPLQRRSFSGANCSYQAVRPGERCVPGATETSLRCQQDQILGLGLRQGQTPDTSIVSEAGSTNGRNALCECSLCIDHRTTRPPRCFNYRNKRDAANFTWIYETAYRCLKDLPDRKMRYSNYHNKRDAANFAWIY